MSWYDAALAGWYRSKIASADAVEQGISQLGTSIGRAIEESRQNGIANQIGGQLANSGAYAPRAALVAPGVNPDTGDENTIAPGTPTGGTAPVPFTGGYRGLQMQTAIDSLRSHQALQNAQMNYYGAHARAVLQNANTSAERAGAYEQWRNRSGAQGSTQDFTNYASSKLGDQAPGWIKAFQGGQPLQRGDVNDNGDWVPSATGKYYSYGSTPQELASNSAPAGDIENIGQKFLKASGGSSNPQPNPQTGTNSGGGLPTLTPQQASQLPPGTQFRGLDGKLYQVPSAQANAGQ